GNSWSGVRSDLIQNMGSGVDMGSPDTLRDFINWTMTFYPADRYVVVLWNHGSGWRLRSDEGGTRGFSFDDEFFTYIKTWELAQALDSTDRIDIVSWDASLMQMMEVAYEAKDRCDYMVGSEESPPAQGLPYDLVFGPLRSNADMPTEQLLQKFGDGMLQFYAGTPFKITQSSVRMSDVPALAAAVDALAVELIAKAGQFDPQIIQARNDAQSYSPSPTRVYRDLWHLAFKLKELINDAQIDAACDGVMAAVDQAVVHEAHNGFSPDSHGIAIEFGDSGQSYWSDYSLLAFSGATLWDEWLVISP
ncbi:MAG: hypothetical protein IH851_06965, partial [Armatimonadetes bacterium]|nr:hypothetical protein [Armatimonadota bacterium]